MDIFQRKKLNMAVGQNLRYLFCRDYHLFKRLLRVTGGTGFWPIAIFLQPLPRLKPLQCFPVRKITSYVVAWTFGRTTIASSFSTRFFGAWSMSTPHRRILAPLGVRSSEVSESSEGRHVCFHRNQMTSHPWKHPQKLFYNDTRAEKQSCRVPKQGDCWQFQSPGGDPSRFEARSRFSFFVRMFSVVSAPVVALFKKTMAM